MIPQKLAPVSILIQMAGFSEHPRQARALLPTRPPLESPPAMTASATIQRMSAHAGAFDSSGKGKDS